MKIVITFHCTALASMAPKELLVSQMKNQIESMMKENEQMKLVFTKADVEALAD